MVTQQLKQHNDNSGERWDKGMQSKWLQDRLGQCLPGIEHVILHFRGQLFSVLAEPPLSYSVKICGGNVEFLRFTERERVGEG